MSKSFLVTDIPNFGNSFYEKSIRRLTVVDPTSHTAKDESGRTYLTNDSHDIWFMEDPPHTSFLIVCGAYPEKPDFKDRFPELEWCDMHNHLYDTSECPICKILQCNSIGLTQ